MSIDWRTFTKHQFLRLRRRIVLLLILLLIGIYFTSTTVSFHHSSTTIPPAFKKDASVTSQPITPKFVKPSTDKPIKIAIATFNTQPERSYCTLSETNKQSYATRHNYDFHIDYAISESIKDFNSPCWHKLVMFERLIATNSYDWIWWIDFDTLITNSSIVLSGIIGDALADVANAEEVDFILSHDCNRLNAGSMFVRSRKSALTVINEIYEAGRKDSSKSEQDAFRELLGPRGWIQPSLSGVPSRDEYDSADTDQLGRVAIIPQWKANAFPAEIKCYDKANRVWEQGMFLLHFAGAWAWIKDEDPYGTLMRKYAPLIV